MMGPILPGTSSMAAESLLKRSTAPWMTGVASGSTILESAARTLAAAPWNVSPDALAESPRPSRIASENVWKSIWPFDTMSETSAVVMCRWSARSWSTGTPELVSCSMSSPMSLPRAATDEKIVPMSLKLLPEAAATFATACRLLVMSWPLLIPAAESVAAAVAASPSP